MIGEVVDFSLVTEKLQAWVNGAIQLLPNLVVALIVFAVFISWHALQKTS